MKICYNQINNKGRCDLNNYCTNCGEKLSKKDLICKKCNAPIIDLPNNYAYESKTWKKIKKIILIVFGIIILCIGTSYLTSEILKAVEINKLQKKYINPYIKNNYNDKNYNIEFDYIGKCIISGDCVFDPLMGCDGGSCYEYEYLDKSECKAYYFKISGDSEEFILTLVNNNNEFYVVKGKNIYDENEDGNINE